MDKNFFTDAISRETLDIIRRMAALAQYRDPEIMEHLDRVRSYCFILARGMGLSIDDAAILSYASQLHDIGEISVPEAVLMKAGSLDPQEWELIRRHPRVGAEILRGSPSVILQAAETIALTHHERWDGSGYPQGLRGEEIPLSGRICALADVFDALTTRRRYKTEIDPQEALHLIQEASDHLFDPTLVKVFAEKFDEILAVLTNQEKEKV